MSVSRLRSLALAPLLAALGVALAGCSDDTAESAPNDDVPAARISDELAADLRRIVEETHAETGVPGMAAGIWIDGVGELTHAVGVSEVGGSQPIGFDEHLRIGSITKTMTGTVILKLVDQGALTLDDTVDQFFDGVPGGDTIRIRHLLAMQSGLASYTFNEDFTDALFAEPMRAWDPMELLQIAWDDTEAGCPWPDQGSQCFPAGTAMAYCNTNTVMLGVIAEQVSERTYAQLVEEIIATPLGLTGTFQGGSALPPPFVHGYTPQGMPEGSTETQEATDWLPSWGFAVGDMVSTMNELHLYGAALATGSLISAEMQAERVTLQTVPPNTPERAYLLGIGIEAGWLGHTGELPGYNSAVHHRPDIHATVVTAANRDIHVFPDGTTAGPASLLARRLHARLNEEVPVGTPWPGT